MLLLMIILLILLLSCYYYECSCCSSSSIGSIGSVEKYQQDAAKFDPYTDNGGTVVGLCGDKYTIIAADTRLSDGVSIYTIVIITSNNIAKRAQGWQ